MKKYKLIKEYPGSPGLNSIANFDLFTNDYCVRMQIIRGVENNPEFWQEVVELDYEILSFKNIHNGNLINQPFPGYSKEDYAGDKPCWNIHSIKRLSNNEVFSVGDLCYPDSAPFNCGKITKFETCKAGSFRIESEGKYYIGLDDLVKTKQPLFVTEDGFEVFKGDTCWYVNYLLTICGGNKQECKGSKHDSFKWFSTKQAAQAYIDENKPKYSELEMISFGKSIQSRYVKPTWPVSEFFKTWKGKNGKR